MIDSKQKSQLLFTTNAVVWIVFGLLWHFYPEVMNKKLNNAAVKREEHDELEDVTRGFGLTLILTGVVELLVRTESRAVIRKVSWARLIYVLILTCGFVVYHRSEFMHRPGFWGALLSMTLPAATLATT